MIRVITNTRPVPADDYTARYWELLSKVQKDMIPIFDRFKSTMERLTGQAREERPIKKMASIYNILPRLKVKTALFYTSLL